MAVNEKGLEKAVTAALSGPGVEDIRIDKFRWNVDHAKVKTDGNLVVVDGRKSGDNISRRLTLQKDDQVFYKFSVQIGQNGISQTDLDIEIEKGGILKTIAVVFEWIVENWDIIKEVFEKLSKEDDFGTSVQSLRKNDELNKLTDSMLDGSWQAEARFLIVNIALLATGQALAKQKPPFLNKLPDFEGGSVIAGSDSTGQGPGGSSIGSVNINSSGEANPVENRP